MLVVKYPDKTFKDLSDKQLLALLLEVTTYLQYKLYYILQCRTSKETSLTND